MSESAAAPATPAAPAAAPEAPAEAPAPLQPPDAPNPTGDSPKDRRARAVEVVKRNRRGQFEKPDAAPTQAAEETPAAEPAEEPKAATAPAEEPEDKGKAEPDDDDRPTAKDWKKLRQEKQLLARQMREIRDAQQKYAAWEAERTEDEKLRASDPYAWARKHGLSFRDMAKKAIGEETKDPRDVAIEELKAEIAELKGFRENYQEQSREQQIEAARSNVRAAVSREFAATSAEDFPFLHTHEADHVADAVTRDLVDHYQRTGEELSPRDVMAGMERQMREYYRRLERAVGKPAPPAPPAKAAPAAAPAPSGDIPSNRVSARASDAGPLTQAEKRQRARALVRDRVGRFS